VETVIWGNKGRS